MNGSKEKLMFVAEQKEIGWLKLNLYWENSIENQHLYVNRRKITSKREAISVLTIG